MRCTYCACQLGSDSVASWQENLFFEPSKFEVGRSLEFLLSKYLEDSMIQENAQVILFALKPKKTLGTIKKELAAIAPMLEMLWKQKDERIKKFSDVQTRIQKICGGIAGNHDRAGNQVVDVQIQIQIQNLDIYNISWYYVYKYSKIPPNCLSTNRIFI